MRRGLVLTLVASGVLLLALIERSLGPRVTAGRLPTGPARWIWAGTGPNGEIPQAFFAARDFDLDAPPPTAEALILADEEYVLYVNGQRVGSNRYRPAARLDRYRVAGLLRAGPNRLLVELRSGRRAGGLVFRLTGPGGLDVVSDRSWSILMRHWGVVADPARPLVQPWPPVVWGSPPVGRWRLPEADGPRASFAEVRTSEARRPARRVRPEGGSWRPAAAPRPATPSLGRVVTFDWGAEVAGYLVLVFDTRLWPRGLVYFGAEPPDPRQTAPGAFAFGPRGRLWWSDAVARRFRYATVVAPEGVKGAYLLPVDEQWAAALLAVEPPGAGVFGLDDPPQLVTSVEDEIWSELEGLAGVDGRESG